MAISAVAYFRTKKRNPSRHWDFLCYEKSQVSHAHGYTIPRVELYAHSSGTLRLFDTITYVCKSTRSGTLLIVEQCSATLPTEHGVSITMCASGWTVFYISLNWSSGITYVHRKSLLTMEQAALKQKVNSKKYDSRDQNYELGWKSANSSTVSIDTAWKRQGKKCLGQEA